MTQLEWWLQMNSLIDLVTLRWLVFVVAAIGVCFGLMDSIAHHDALSGWGNYWSYEAYVNPKTGWLDRYLPMFGDAWHLLKFLVIVLIGAAIGLVADCWAIGAACCVLMNVFFFISYR